MRVFADRLTPQLEKHFKGVYLIFGSEPLLIAESRAAIWQHAQKHGFEEKHRFGIDNSLDWNTVYDCFQAMSLFSARQVVELELPESGVNAAIAKELLQLADLVHPDTMLILIGGKLTKAQENSKWFKALSANGDWVSCLTPDIERLPQFVQQRCRALGLSPDPQAVQMLAQWHEGNLFALSQSLEKLALLYPDGQLSLIRLEESLSRHNHFTAFHWIDALLAGKAKRSQRILRQLEAESVEPVILLRSLQRELMQLTKMHQDGTTMSLHQVLDKYRVWSNKKPLYTAALQRVSAKKIMRLLTLVAQAELLFKTQYDQSTWPLIHQLSLEMCSPEVEIPYSL